MPCITSFITCEPASNVPVHPSAAIFHASGPRFTKNSETIVWLPGGKNCVRSSMRSNKLVFPDAVDCRGAGDEPDRRQRHGNQQRREKRQKKIEGNRLRNHAAPWKYAGKHPVHPPKEPRR